MGLGNSIYNAKINTWWLDSNFIVFLLLLPVRLFISSAPSWLMAKMDIPHLPAPRGRRISCKKGKKNEKQCFGNLETIYLVALYKINNFHTTPNTNIVSPHKSHSPSHTSGAAAPRAAPPSTPPRSPLCLPGATAVAV